MKVTIKGEKMTDNKNERQNVMQMYENLSDDKRILFKTIIDLTIVLLNGMQIAERRI